MRLHFIVYPWLCPITQSLLQILVLPRRLLAVHPTAFPFSVDDFVETEPATERVVIFVWLDHLHFLRQVLNVNDCV